jgi:hypothetical protein
VTPNASASDGLRATFISHLDIFAMTVVVLAVVGLVA